MAVAMRDAAGKLIATWRRHGSELGFGVGIAQGYATLARSALPTAPATPPSVRYAISPPGFVPARRTVKSSVKSLIAWTSCSTLRKLAPAKALRLKMPNQIST